MILHIVTTWSLSTFIRLIYSVHGVVFCSTCLLFAYIFWWNHQLLQYKKSKQRSLIAFFVHPKIISLWVNNNSFGNYCWKVTLTHQTKICLYKNMYVFLYVEWKGWYSIGGDHVLKGFKRRYQVFGNPKPSSKKKKEKKCPRDVCPSPWASKHCFRI